MLKKLKNQFYSSQSNVAQDQVSKDRFVARHLSTLSLGLTTLAFAFGVLTSSNVKNMADRAGSYLLEKVPYFDEMRATRFIQQYDEMDWSESSERSVADISAEMGKNPSLRRHVLNAYLGESFFSQKRYGTHQLFLAYFDPDRFKLAKSLIQKKSSPLDKINGINLIIHSGLDDTDAFQEQFRDILFSESDSHVLITTVMALTRPAVPAPALRQRVVNKLHELSSSPSKLLRRVAVRKLAEWDGDGQISREDILRLMSDPDAEVRIDAIQACGTGPTHHISIKNRLVQMLGDVNEDRVVQEKAWNTLYSYDLNEDEYETYNSFMKSYSNFRAN